MKKILVNIYVPILGRDYDAFIPADASVQEVLKLLYKATAAVSDGGFAENQTTALCLRETGEILNPNHFVFELGIQNGSKLMII